MTFVGWRERYFIASLRREKTRCGHVDRVGLARRLPGTVNTHEQNGRSALVYVLTKLVRVIAAQYLASRSRRSKVS